MTRWRWWLTRTNDQRHVATMPRGLPQRRTPPDVILRSLYLDPRGITPASFAKRTGVALAIINGQARFTPSAATKIGEALGTSPQFWLILEASFRAWSERQRK
jgi:plasmid maintenance system antidote protein VapI